MDAFLAEVRRRLPGVDVVELLPAVRPPAVDPDPAAAGAAARESLRETATTFALTWPAVSVGARPPRTVETDWWPVDAEAGDGGVAARIVARSGRPAALAATAAALAGWRWAVHPLSPERLVAARDGYRLDVVAPAGFPASVTLLGPPLALGPVGRALAARPTEDAPFPAARPTGTIGFAR